MVESWEELSLASASPAQIGKSLESVVMKEVAKATKQQRGTGDITATADADADADEASIC